MNKLTCFSNITDDFAVLKDSGILTNERIDEIKSWVAPEAFEPVKLASGKVLEGWRLHTLTSKMYNESNFKDGWGKNYIYRQIFEDLLTGEEIEKINKRANSIWSAKQDAAQYEKAEKVFLNDYSGWFYSETHPYNNGYFEDIDEYLDYICEEQDNLPDGKIELTGSDYVWAAKSRPVCYIDLDSVLENATQDVYEDFEIGSLKGLEELKNAIDIFNELNKDNVVYEQDTKKVILL